MACRPGSAHERRFGAEAWATPCRECGGGTAAIHHSSERAEARILAENTAKVTSDRRRERATSVGVILPWTVIGRDQATCHGAVGVTVLPMRRAQSALFNRDLPRRHFCHRRAHRRELIDTEHGVYLSGDGRLGPIGPVWLGASLLRAGHFKSLNGRRLQWRLCRWGRVGPRCKRWSSRTPAQSSPAGG